MEIQRQTPSRCQESEWEDPVSDDNDDRLGRGLSLPGCLGEKEREEKKRQKIIIGFDNNNNNNNR